MAIVRNSQNSKATSSNSQTLIERAIANSSGRKATTVQPADSQTNRAEVYANFGAELNGELVTLPFGLGIDNMNELSLRGSNEEYLASAAKRNAFLRRIQKIGASLAPDEEVRIPMIVTLRRVKDNAAVPTVSEEIENEMDELFKDFI